MSPAAYCLLTISCVFGIRSKNSFGIVKAVLYKINSHQKNDIYYWFIYFLFEAPNPETSPPTSKILKHLLQPATSIL
jgi:hypothetical protein